MNFNQDLNINFLKSQATIGELRKVVKEAQSPIKPYLVTSGGDKFVARQGNNQYPQDVSEGSSTSYPSKPNTSLKPQTSDLLSKININNIKNTETYKGDVIRSMGIEIL